MLSLTCGRDQYGVPVISGAKLEQFAEELIGDYRSELLKSPQPTDIEQFVECYLRANLEVRPITATHSILGVAVFDEGRTLPSLLPTACVLLIMNSGWILNSNMDMFMVFQNPTNLETMEVLDMYIYKYGLKLMDYSYATAASIAKTVVSLLMLLIVNKTVDKLNGTGIF